MQVYEVKTEYPLPDGGVYHYSDYFRNREQATRHIQEAETYRKKNFPETRNVYRINEHRAEVDSAHPTRAWIQREVMLRDPDP